MYKIGWIEKEQQQHKTTTQRMKTIQKKEELGISRQSNNKWIPVDSTTSSLQQPSSISASVVSDVKRIMLKGK